MKLKKTLISVLTVFAAMLALSGCATAATAGAEGAAGGSMMMSMMPLLIVLPLMYVMIAIPERKRKKKAQEMRDSVEVGDKITTIGGLVGKVVHVSSERVTFETSEDRVRIEICKWAISVNEGKGANKEVASSDETLSN